MKNTRNGNGLSSLGLSQGKSANKKKVTKSPPKGTSSSSILLIIVRKQARGLLLWLALLLTGMMVAPAGIFAQGIGSQFELDGNITNAPPGLPDDWQTLFAGGGGAAVFTGIVADPVNSTSDDTFTGGSHIEQQISDWMWTYSKANDKTDINNVAVAMYTTNVVGQAATNLFFMADTTSVNGDSKLSLWLFHK